MEINAQGIGAVELPHSLQDFKLSRNGEESRLVRRAQSGDSAAFSSLIRPYIRLSYCVALKITGNPEDAEDASQQCLMEAYKHINQFNGKSQFSTWLTRIAINEALMKLRKRRSVEVSLSRQVGTEDERDPAEMVAAGDDVHPEALFLKWETERRVRKSIAELPDVFQAVVWLRGMKELKIKETARILALSETAVKSRFMRACRQLRKSLADRI